MNLVQLLGLAVAVAGLVLVLVAVVRAVRADGYGARVPPRSHADWSDLSVQR